MLRVAISSVVLAVGCSAPEIADLPTDVSPPPTAEPSAPRTPSPSPAELAGRTPAPRREARPAAPAPPPPPATPPPSLEPTPESSLGAPPFTAWTTHAPLTPVGPGGTPVARISRLGVRIEVVQVLDHRTRFTCTGCPGDTAGVEAWLQPERLRAAGAPGTPTDPLVVALQIRARWAGGKDLPEGSTPGQMCALVDAGFTWDGGEHATWETAGGQLVLAWHDGRWSIESARAPHISGDCRTRRATPA